MTLASAGALSVLDATLRRVDRVLKVVLTIVFALILVAVLAQVVARYVLHTSLVGPDEIARYAMVACAFLAIPILAYLRENIAVDALAHFLPNGAPTIWLTRVIFLVEFAFYVVFAWYSLEYSAGVFATGQSSVALSIPLWIPTVTLIIGSVLGAVVTVLLLVRSFLAPDSTSASAALSEEVSA